MPMPSQIRFEVTHHAWCRSDYRAAVAMHSPGLPAAAGIRWRMRSSIRGGMGNGGFLPIS